MPRIRSRISYANVLATLALFVALGGGAYAASVAKNSVKSSSIKNNAVRTADVRDNGLGGADIDEASLGQVPSAANADNAQSAETANTAQSAQSAVNAESAQNSVNAELAQNSLALNGHPINRVLGETFGNSDNADPDKVLSAAGDASSPPVESARAGLATWS